KSYFKKYQIIETIKVFKTNGISLKNLKTSELDDIDYKILNILRDNQGLKPISTYEIRNIFKEKLKDEISQSTIYNRIKKLEQQDIILNYTVNFSPKKIGFEGKYLIRIKPKDPSKYNELALKLDMNKNITYLFRIGEQYGLFGIVRVKKIEDYATFIRELYSSEEIEDTYTNFVLDELISYVNFTVF
ncbi:MAG: Lrp/AsnC family transcriptional regulator, partial [Promethearchaeota archaeon]